MEKLETELKTIIQIATREAISPIFQIMNKEGSGNPDQVSNNKFIHGMTLPSTTHRL